MPASVDGTDIEFQISKSDGSPWTNDEVESLFMVANGKVIAASASSSIDFFYQGSEVAYINRDFVGETHATVHCKANGFGGTSYSVTYLGWDEPPTPVSLIVTPTPPTSLRGADIVLRKSDGSNFTAQEVTGLKITMDGSLLSLGTSSEAYYWYASGPELLTVPKQESYGAEITLHNGGYANQLDSIELT